ncbi:sensor histidine kinase [Salinarimonas sp.]|uniref:sensor histidine kinase n=1 Tax=Salinarimonas sp. TaxID=2766526 RepID=UPI0032D91B20
MLVELARGDGLAAHACPAEALESRLGEDSLALILTEEALAATADAALARAVARQPSWSSLPVLALVEDASGGGSARLRGLGAAIDLVVLERPIRARVLSGALHALARSRERQYAIRDQIVRLDEQRAHVEFLFRELDHRVKNVLAKVQGMAKLSGRNAEDVESFLSDFQGRLLALARAHDTLAGEYEKRTTLRDLVHSTLASFRDEGNLSLEGPEVVLWPQAALTLAMTLNELATNAAKYGALSVEGGRVEVDWRIDADGGAPILAIDWTERDGPRVEAPVRKNFGTTLIERIMPTELDGACKLSFDPNGVVCRMAIPIEPEDGRWRPASDLSAGMIEP